MPVASYSFIASIYFIGFGFGLTLFLLPDLLGRRGALKISLTVFSIAGYLSVFSTSVHLKAAGFIVQGIFHVKYVTCFVQASEFMPDDYKVFGMTVINCFDSLTVGITSCLLLCGLRYQQALAAYYFVGLAATILYFLLVPETPTWHFLKDGTNSQDGIAVLNYIAWLNGVEYRVPPTAKIGLALDATVEQSRRNINVSMSVSAMHRSMLNYTSVTVGRENTKTAIQVAKKTFKELYNCSAPSRMHLKLHALFFCQCFVYYIILFNGFELGGDPIKKGVFFGIAEGLGVLLVDRLVHYVPDTQGSVFAYPMIALLATALSHPDLNENMLYGLLILQVMSIGYIYNVTMVVQESRTKPKYAAMSLELVSCCGNMIASFTPLVSKLPHPYPLISYWVIAFIGVITSLSIGSKDVDCK